MPMTFRPRSVMRPPGPPAGGARRGFCSSARVSAAEVLAAASEMPEPRIAASRAVVVAEVIVSRSLAADLRPPVTSSPLHHEETSVV